MCPKYQEPLFKPKRLYYRCSSVSYFDKSVLFEIFHGEVENAPMIKECPINMECRLYDIYDTPTHDLFIGQIVETDADESVLTEGKIDLAKLKPLLFDMSSIKYWSVGEVVADCWKVGKQLKREKEV